MSAAEAAAAAEPALLDVVDGEEQLIDERPKLDCGDDKAANVFLF